MSDDQVSAKVPLPGDFAEQHRTDVRWLGWAIQLHREPWFYVEYGGNEASAWQNALGWPDAEGIAHAKAQGARAFPVSILERRP